MRIGYNRAARLVDQMEAAGVLSAPEHNGNRSLLVPQREMWFVLCLKHLQAA